MRLIREANETLAKEMAKMLLDQMPNIDDELKQVLGDYLEEEGNISGRNMLYGLHPNGSEAEDPIRYQIIALLDVQKIRRFGRWTPMDVERIWKSIDEEPWDIADRVFHGSIDSLDDLNSLEFDSVGFEQCLDLIARCYSLSEENKTRLRNVSSEALSACEEWLFDPLADEDE